MTSLVPGIWLRFHQAFAALNSNKQTEQVLFRNRYTYKYMYMHVITINKKEAMNMNESNEGYLGGVKRKKWKEE